MRFTITLLVLVMIFTASLLAVEVPNIINFQGYLSNAGTPLDGSFELTFKIYDVPTAGTELWTETRTFDVTDGYYSILLGEATPIDIAFSGNIWIGVQITGQSEMSPRYQIASMPYAYVAKFADSVADNSIDSAKIENGSISLFDLHNGNASPGQALKWNGAEWVPGDDEVGGAEPGEGWVDDGTVVRLNTSTDSVGIGTAFPRANLEVIGSLMATKEIKVGTNHTISAGYSSITGGDSNSVVAAYSHIGGGESNKIYGTHSFIGGGGRDTAYGIVATICGGTYNSTTASSGGYSTIVGGTLNRAKDAYDFIGGGEGNTAGGHYSTIGGGYYNLTDSSYSFVGGGYGDTALGDYSTVGGGYNNVTALQASTIAGGYANQALGQYDFIGGGYVNQTTGGNGFIGGGHQNYAQGQYSSIAGGLANHTDSQMVFIGGGGYNYAEGTASAIVGGERSAVYGTHSFIGGGYQDTVFGDNSNICGGSNNVVTIASEGYSVIGGGGGNKNESAYSVIGGGLSNLTGGAFSTIPGGKDNSATGDFSYAAGYSAWAFHKSTFVWNGDTTGSFISTDTGQFLINAPGGVGINTASPTGAELDVNGDIRCVSLTQTSDIRFKKNIKTINNALASVMLIDGVKYDWKNELTDNRKFNERRQIGLVAQDVEEVFPELVSTDDQGYKSVSYSKMTAVLLEAIKELKKENDELKSRMDIMEKSQ